MKLGLLFSMFALFLLIPSSKASAAFGSLPDYKVPLWRSSYTETAVRTTMFSSGPVVIRGIIVGSTTVNEESFFALSKSTSAVIGNWMSTATTITTNIVSKSYAVLSASNAVINNFQSNDKNYTFDIISENYTFIQRTGPAKITVLWDWLDRQFANPTPE